MAYSASQSCDQRLAVRGPPLRCSIATGLYHNYGLFPGGENARRGISSIEHAPDLPRNWFAPAALQ